MTTVEKSIEVAVPTAVAYAAWTQFESLPTFMHNVSSVRRLDDRHLHWEATIGSAHREWDAEITELVPGELIAWRSTTGTRNDGQVRFEALEGDRCRVLVRFDHDPDNWVEELGDKLGVVSTTIEADLERFRDHVQTLVATDDTSAATDGGPTAGEAAADDLASDYGHGLDDVDDPTRAAPTGERERLPAMAGSTWDSTPAPAPPGPSAATGPA